MTIVDYIKTYYPIGDKIKQYQDPYVRVANENSLPYDMIGPDENGVVTKLVEIDDDRYISVADLLSYDKSDVEKLDDQALLNVYNNYMSSIDIEDVNIIDIMLSLKQHSEHMKKKKEQLNVLSS